MDRIDTRTEKIRHFECLRNISNKQCARLDISKLHIIHIKKKKKKSIVFLM